MAFAICSLSSWSGCTRRRKAYVSAREPLSCGRLGAEVGAEVGARYGACLDAGGIGGAAPRAFETLRASSCSGRSDSSPGSRHVGITARASSKPVDAEAKP